MQKFLRHILIAFALFFAAAQGASAVHASVHGDEPHEHNGISCDIGLTAPDVTPDLPEPVEIATVTDEPKLVFAIVANSFIIWETPPGRAPPPRSPPA